MESAFYGYYFVIRNCISSTWEKEELERIKTYLLNNKFTDKGKGLFTHNETFLSLQFMLVKDYNSWSSNNYNRKKANYISIVTLKDLEPLVKKFFKEFESFIGWYVIEEKDND
ncbi:MAG: hypothetical protein FWD48_00630 [Oscillospiraceae bacterium]|nr:hypothetical protein [Oscillospiraceae bacterium]